MPEVAATAQAQPCQSAGDRQARSWQLGLFWGCQTLDMVWVMPSDSTREDGTVPTSKAKPWPLCPVGPDAGGTERDGPQRQLQLMRPLRHENPLLPGYRHPPYSITVE